MVKLDAIFSDYDGTLCRLELPREEAFIAPRLRRVLLKASRGIKIGIVTTKDLSFIKERVPFAQGFAGTCGLEIEVGDRKIIDERVQPTPRGLDTAYQGALKRILQIRDNIMIERKETDDGELIGLCVDWRLSRNWDEARRKAAPILTLCKEQGLFVIESEISPFANIFPVHVDKGEALSKLRTEMKVTGPVMYLGDSEADDPAFKLADVSVGIKHRRTMPALQCKHRLEFFELENFLSDLIDADFDFRDSMLERNM